MLINITRIERVYDTMKYSQIDIIDKLMTKSVFLVNYKSYQEYDLLQTF